METLNSGELDIWHSVKPWYLVTVCCAHKGPNLNLICSSFFFLFQIGCYCCWSFIIYPLFILYSWKPTLQISPPVTDNVPVVIRMKSHFVLDISTSLQRERKHKKLHIILENKCKTARNNFLFYTNFSLFNMLNISALWGLIYPVRFVFYWWILLLVFRFCFFMLLFCPL